MKKLKFYLLSLLIFFSCLTHSQDWIESNSITSSSSLLIPRGLVSDDSGNSYLTAVFKDTCEIGNLTKYSNGHFDILLAKYNSKSEVVWALNIGGKEKDNVRELIIDQSNNLYIAGSINDTVIFNSAELSYSDTLINKGEERTSFVAKYSSNGNLLWAELIGIGTGENFLAGIIVDEDDNLIMGGTFGDTIYFATDTLISKGVRDFFLIKVNHSREIQWAEQIQCSGAETYWNQLLGGVKQCGNEGYSFSGIFYDTLYIKHDTIISKGICDAILFKTNLNGEIEWYRQAGSSNYDRCNAMYNDDSGNIYIAGYISDSATFDSTNALDSRHMRTNGGFDIMFAKYSKDGELVWCKNEGAEGWDISYDIFIKDSIAYLTGYTSGSSIWGTDTINTQSSTNSDPIIALINTNNGNVIKAYGLKGNDYVDRGIDINVDAFNNITVLGEYYSDTLTIADNILVNSKIDKCNVFYGKLGFDLSCSLPELNYKQCDSISIPIRINISGQSNVGSIDCEISGYSDKLDFISLTTDSTLTGLANWAFSVNETDSSIIIASAGAYDITESGILFYLNFTVPFIEPDTILIKFSKLQLNEYTFDINTNNGYILVDSVENNPGDVSLNGSVSSFDASLVLKELVELTTLNCAQLANADFSEDYTISSLDAFYILQESSGIQQSMNNSEDSSNALLSSSINMEDDVVSVGQTVDVEVNITPMNSLNAFYQEFTFDNNVLTLNSVNWKSNISDMTIFSNTKNGKLQIAAASLESTNNDKDISSILNFTVKEKTDQTATSIILKKLQINESPALLNAGNTTLSFGNEVSQINDINSNNTVTIDNYPNPFTENIKINLKLANSSKVLLNIYNINGQLVNTLINENISAGAHTLTWKGDNSKGKIVPSGHYFYKIVIGDSVITKQILKLK